MDDIELDKEKCIRFLISSAEIGQKNGSYSIKDAAHLYKAVQFFSKDDSSKSGLTEDEAIGALTRSIVIANKNGAYSLGDASLLFNVLEFMEKDASTKVV